MIPKTQFPAKAVVASVVQPLRMYFSPRIFGMENVKADKPALYVGNHTIFGLTDGVFLGVELYLQKDIQLRTLVDELHMEVPFWRNLVTDLGMVKADRELCSELMDEGAHILVFPGGRREIFKKKGEAYKLRWENRYGFIRMALSHGYDIIPVASVGGEETYEIVVDSKEVLESPLGWALRVSGINDNFLKKGDHIPPIAKGLGWTGLPKPAKLYIKVGERISTKEHMDQSDDPDILELMKFKVEVAFQDMFQELQEIRNQEKEEPWRWFLKRL